MNYLGLKRQLGRISRNKSNNRKIILLYHSVGNTPWALSKNKFDEQINWLCDNCKVLSLYDLISEKPSKEIQVSISFDDGYACLYDYALPIFSDKKITGTIFINTGWISDNSKLRNKSIGVLGHYPNETFLVWNEICDFYNENWEIGSHGVNHLDFTKLDNQRMELELSLSKKHIEERLKCPCLYFAYPWGRYSRQVKHEVSKAGYRYGIAGYHGPLTSKCDFLSLPRINISKEYTFHDFKNIVTGKWDYLGYIQQIRGLYKK